jgi:hypothetical protein
MESLARYPAPPYAAGPVEARMNVAETPHVESMRKPGSLTRRVAGITAFPDLLKGAPEASEPRFADGMLAGAAHDRTKSAGAGELLSAPSNPVTQRPASVAPGTCGRRTGVNQSFIISF